MGGFIDDFFLLVYNYFFGGEKRKVGLVDVVVVGWMWFGIVLFGGVGCGKC